MQLYTSFAISGDVMTTCLTEPTWIENMGPYFAAQVVKLRCGFFSVSCNRLPNNGSPGIAANPNPLPRETNKENSIRYTQEAVAQSLHTHEIQQVLRPPLVCEQLRRNS